MARLTVAEWSDLIRSMLPGPVTTDGNRLHGGELPEVTVELAPDRIAVIEPRFVWEGPHELKQHDVVIASLALDATPAKVARTIMKARSRRISKLRWCPGCREVTPPEHMSHRDFCDSCAEQKGIVL